MMRLFGHTPEQARAMCLEWYVKPVAARILSKKPDLGSLFFMLRASESEVLGAFGAASDVDAHSPQLWVPQAAVTEAQLSLFGRQNPLDPEIFGRAFWACCPPEERWGVVAIVRRRMPPPTTVPLVVLESRVTLYEAEASWDSGMRVGGRVVQDVQGDLSLLDANAHVLWRLERVLEALEAVKGDEREKASLEWALHYLRWSLEE